MADAVGSLSQAVGASPEGAESIVGDARHGWIVRLIRDEGEAIRRLLWRMLGSEQDVLDAYQDTFCKLAARDGKVDVRSAKAYAFRTAVNIAIEMIRTRRRRGAHWPAIVRERAAAEGVVMSAAANARRMEAASPSPPSERFREAIAQLPPHLRNVIVLRDLSRLSYREVGHTLGINAATARVYRRHAVVRLAGLLAEGAE